MSGGYPYDTCRQILRASGSSFATAFRLLPLDQREAMTAFYAFCRQVDDAVDEAPDEAAARLALAAWRGRLVRLDRPDPGDPVCLALAEAVARFGIDPAHLDLILDGVEQDLQQSRYQTFPDLYAYCYRVASAVGLVCVDILGGRRAELQLYAELSGIAVQLTNILRDLREDAGRDRIYLPREDLACFGVREEDVLCCRSSPAMDRLIQFELQRTRQYYHLAKAALPPDCRHRLFFAETLRETYQRLFERLADLGGGILFERPSLGTAERLAIALRRRLHPATFRGIGS